MSPLMSQATLFRPILSTILRDRRFGIPCPGCGMTRATVFLFRGNWKEAMTMHAFAPIFLVGLAVVAFCTVGPRRQIDRVIAGTERLERHTGITTILLAGLILYWV